MSNETYYNGGPVAEDLAGMFTVKEADRWVDEARRRPDPVPLWDTLWYQGELCCLFADTNVGKSIYAVQIAAHIAQTQKVLYFDFEMSDKQFQMRYTDEMLGCPHYFGENFLRCEFNRLTISAMDLGTIMAAIETETVRTGAKVVIIDNLTWLCNRSENGDAAGELMQMLTAIKHRQGLSILVLAHTPKRNTSAPLTQNSLAGSKRLANFMDSIFAIGTTNTDRPQGRYIIQLKVRCGEMLHGTDNVITARLHKVCDMVMLEHIGTDRERNLLDEPDADDIERDSARDEIRRRLADGQPYRSIAAELGTSAATVCRIAKSMRTCTD